MCVCVFVCMCVCVCVCVCVCLCLQLCISFQGRSYSLKTRQGLKEAVPVSLLVLQKKIISLNLLLAKAFWLSYLFACGTEFLPTGNKALEYREKEKDMTPAKKVG